MVRFSTVDKTRIGLLGPDCGSDLTPDRIGLRDQIGPAIRLKSKVTLKVIACWLLYDCEGLG